MKNILNISNEHNDWLRSLAFYKDELGILQNRLTEVAGKNTGEEASKGAGHFENQLKIQITNIDVLHHDINEFLHKAAEQAEQHAGRVEDDMMAKHDKLRDRFIAEEKTLLELRHEFNRYAAKWI